MFCEVIHRIDPKIKKILVGETRLLCRRELICPPRAVDKSSCARQSLNFKTLLRMSFNTLHGGTHEFPRTKHISSHQGFVWRRGFHIRLCPMIYLLANLHSIQLSVSDIMASKLLTRIECGILFPYKPLAGISSFLDLKDELLYQTNFLQLS